MIYNKISRMYLLVHSSFRIFQCDSCPRDLILHTLSQASHRNSLLHIRRQLPNLLAPCLSALALSVRDLTPPHIPFKCPTRPPCRHFVAAAKLLPQPLHQPRHLHSYERIIDAIPAEHVSKAPCQHERDPFRKDRRSRLLARAAGSKIKARHWYFARLG